MTPKISVVMPVLNGEKYLREAIESILNQTFKNFEFIIINDGSTDKTEEIIKSFNDSRIVYIKNEENLGLSKSFNIGIRAAKGEYIVRMDADDVSESERFEKQIKFLEENSDVGIVGSYVRNIDEEGKFGKIFKRPKSHTEIKWQSLFSTPIVHPTVFARAKVLKENPFDESLHNSEDYELWSRLIFEKNIRFANIPEPLLRYRVYQSSFTQSLNWKRRLTSVNNSVRNIERYTPLSEAEKGALLAKRPIASFNIYRRAAKKFYKKERFKPSLGRYFLALVRRFFA